VIAGYGISGAGGRVLELCSMQFLSRRKDVTQKRMAVEKSSGFGSDLSLAALFR